MAIVASFPEHILKLSSSVSKNAELLGVRISKNHFEVDAATKNAVGRLKRGIKLDYGTKWEFFEEAGVIRIDTEINVKIPHLFTTEPFLAEVSKQSVILQAFYQVPTKDRPDRAQMEELIDAFAKVNGPYTAWPFLREAIQNNLTRASLQCAPLPFLKIEVAPKSEEESPTDNQE